jgi:mRNA interferase RelE/StbE
VTRPRYEVLLTPSALRAFRKLERGVQVRLAHLIDSLAFNPRTHGSVKLSGEENLYRVRTGDYRIIYSIEDDVLIVLIVAVGHRREVYR